jgi:hypothetical protein
MTTVKPLNVRIANLSDEADIYNLLTGEQGLYQENALFEMSAPKVRRAINMGLVRYKGVLGTPNGPKGIIGVIEHDGKVVASVGMEFVQFWYSEDWLLSELWNFVHPDFRKTTYAQDLINFAKWCSDGLSIPLHMGIISKSRVKAKVRLYKRTIPYAGGYFIHGIEGMEIDPLDQTDGAN